ncbi:MULTISPECIES: hypothetical protein [Hyphomonas]|uniref:hypothetical protein n=1 Tax=Hyphomonas TaxID=85 RepID=UPI00186B67F1|nr:MULTISPECIES: hypothetical protein [Hyphomonas]
MKADPDDVPGLDPAIAPRHPPAHLVLTAPLENRHRRSASVQQIVQQNVQQFKFDGVQPGAIQRKYLRFFRALRAENRRKSGGEEGIRTLDTR